MSIIQIVDEISKKITGITTNVEKIKTSHAINKKKIIDDLTKIKGKIQTMKQSCERGMRECEEEKSLHTAAHRSAVDQLAQAQEQLSRMAKPGFLRARGAQGHVDRMKDGRDQGTSARSGQKTSGLQMKYNSGYTNRPAAGKSTDGGGNLSGGYKWRSKKRSVKKSPSRKEKSPTKKRKRRTQ